MRLLFVVTRIQHLMRDLQRLQHGRESLGLLDRNRADENGLAALGAVADHVDDRLVFLIRRPVDLVVLVIADHGPVGRNLEGFELIDVEELAGFRQRRAGHARELVVEAEVVLEGDGRERLVFRLNVYAFLGFERLMQPFGVAPSFHHAAGEFIDNDDLALADHIVAIPEEELVRAKRLGHVVDQADILDIVERGFGLEEAGLLQHFLHALVALLRQHDGAHFLVELEILFREARDERVDGVVKLGFVVDRARDDERRARLVDEDRVHLVDDGVGMSLKLRRTVAELDHLRNRILHIIAQIIEAEFVVRAIGDVAAIGLPALVVIEFVHDAANRQAEKPVDLAHPFGVALGEVIVHRDDVHAAARKSIEISGERGDERFAFARLHFGNLALVQHHAAHELHVEVTLAKRALCALADCRKGFRQQVVEAFAIGETLPELDRFGAHLFVGQGREFGLERVDRRNSRIIAFQAPIVGAAEDLGCKRAKRNHDSRASLPL